MKMIHLAIDARSKGWGLVVDQPSVEALVDAIRKIIQDEDLQRRLVSAAWMEARRRDSRLISQKLQRVLGVIN